MRRIGIDVGGTNTDAVLLQDGKVVHAVKTPTTEDVTGGIVAALGKLSRHREVTRVPIAGFREAIAASHIEAPLFITQNDGTVMSAEMAMALPVMSFASGATNSMRGAAFLSGVQDTMVVDVGGTSSDVGKLRRGFPREANSVVEIGEVRTLFRMPDLFSIGLGGGSIVTETPFSVGPQSVGYRLTG